MTCFTPLTVMATRSALAFSSSLGKSPFKVAVPLSTFTSIGCVRRSGSSSSFVVTSTSTLTLDVEPLDDVAGAADGAGVGTATVVGADGGTTTTCDGGAGCGVEEGGGTAARAAASARAR